MILFGSTLCSLCRASAPTAAHSPPSLGPYCLGWGSSPSSESLALFLRFRSLAPSRSWRPALSFPCLALLLVAPSPPVALSLGVVPGDWSHQFYVHFLCLLSRFPTYYQRTLYIKEKKNPLCGDKLHLPPPLFLVLTRLRSISFAVPFGLVRLPRALEAPSLLCLKV